MAERDAVVDTEPDVEQDGVDLLLGDETNHADPVGGFQDLMAFPPQNRGQQRPQAVVVFGNENR